MDFDIFLRWFWSCFFGFFLRFLEVQKGKFEWKFDFLWLRIFDRLRRCYRCGTGAGRLTIDPTRFWASARGRWDSWCKIYRRARAVFVDQNWFCDIFQLSRMKKNYAWIWLYYLLNSCIDKKKFQTICSSVTSLIQILNKLYRIIVKKALNIFSILAFSSFL